MKFSKYIKYNHCFQENKTAKKLVANNTLKRFLAFPTLYYILSYKGRRLAYYITSIFQ